ncbi:MAG: acyltransferase, partial [Candidatus Phocaeicola excrementipullorum]|nr:acyltransferase [Candidatus Phocaeicola excrementipullorum]
IGGNCVLIDTDAHNMNYIIRRGQNTDWGISSPIVIEDDVFIGVNCIILKGVTIGARSIIAAGSVVTKSIPADCIAGGNPAKVIRLL